jgi:hypothetical protein
MPRRSRIDSRTECIARKDDAAAKWLAENDGAPISAELAEKRAADERGRLMRAEARRRSAFHGVSKYD